jgi:chemosensory pili system protein ChpB (putative protein-glutamate methylesterase)
MMIESPSYVELRRIKLAIVSNSLRHRKQLQKVLEHYGLQVIFNEPLSPAFMEKLHSGSPDVLLLDVDDKAEHDDILLEQLLNETEVPIIFNDVSALTVNEPTVLARWYGKLLGKIAELTGHMEGDELDLDLHWQTAIQAGQTTMLEGQADLARDVWVLGASLGGPEALKQFLSALPGDLPVAFIIAQHLGAGFMDLLARQLDRVTSLQVVPARVGHVLRHQQVLIAPINERMKISPIGAVELLPLHTQSRYNPSVDMIFTDMAQRYGKRCHGIIFSGMCDDGVQGAQQLVDLGCEVWTQAANSCVISAMPDHVRQAGHSSFSGTPVELAQRLAARYR